MTKFQRIVALSMVEFIVLLACFFCAGRPSHDWIEWHIVRGGLYATVVSLAIYLYLVFFRVGDIIPPPATRARTEEPAQKKPEQESENVR